MSKKAIPIPVWAIEFTNTAHLFAPNDYSPGWDSLCRKIYGADVSQLQKPPDKTPRCKMCQVWLDARPERFPHLKEATDE